MIFGIGTDIVQIGRIEEMMERLGERFITRCFSNKEIAQAERYSDNLAGRVAYYAKRFAAKEAFVKAVGTGFRKGINFKDISIMNEPSGRPKLVLNASAQRWLETHVPRALIFVSLSDDYPIAQAMVVISQEG